MSEFDEQALDLEQALVDDSASEVVAARLAKAQLGAADVKAVGEDAEQPGIGGAASPDHPATGSTAAAGQPATPSKQPGSRRRSHERSAKGKEPVAEGAAAGAGATSAAAAAAVSGPGRRPDVPALLQQSGFITALSDYCYGIPQGHVKGMRVPAKFYANPKLLSLVVGELQTASGGFEAAVNQLSNVATLPGIKGGPSACQLPAARFLTAPPFRLACPCPARHCGRLHRHARHPQRLRLCNRQRGRL
ncbi:hypothetical protein ABPG75_002616 [Micractinium tetrahymenae]